MKKRIILLLLALLTVVSHTFGQIIIPNDTLIRDPHQLPIIDPPLIGSFLGNTIDDPISAGVHSTTFSYSHMVDIYKYTNDYIGLPGSDVFYQFTISQPMNVVISHCGSTLFDTYIYLLDMSGTCIAYNDDYSGSEVCTTLHACLKMDNLETGTYYVVSEGYFFIGGSITTTIEGTVPGNDITGNTMPNAIDVGSKSTGFSYSDTKDTKWFTNDYNGQSTYDVFYKFTITTPMDIAISHCGSGLNATRAYLLNSLGVLFQGELNSNILSCGNSEQARFEMMDIPAGTYYVVSEGANENGNITTTIEGRTIPGNIANGSLSQNYMMTITPTTASPLAETLVSDQYIQTIQYFDGLGRPEQSVLVRANSTKKDLITYQEYDFLGRESNSWLPTVATENNGQFVSYSNFVIKAAETYTGEAKPYSKPVYENSPLNRIVEQYGAGQEWHNNGKAVKTTYLSNNADHPCKLYTVPDDAKTVAISQSGSYANSQLFVTKFADEEGNTSYEFKNKQGQVVLTRQMNEEIPNDTYYVYDVYGNLRVVLPPLAADTLSGGNWTETNSTLQQYAYLYKYDEYNRCIAKKLPGAEWIYYVYDKADRLIFMQDGEQRAKGQWLFTIPDALGRTVLTGTCGNSLNYLIDPLKNVTVKATWTGANYNGYAVSNLSLTGTVKVLTAYYYDSHDFLSMSGYSTLSYVTPENGYGTNSGSHKGLLTGTFTAEAGEGSGMLYAALYYDERGRLIQSQSTNHLGGKESVYTAYNFSGQPTKSKAVHTAPGKTTQTEYLEYSYDHAGRLLDTKHKLNNTSAYTTLVQNTYDELGRLKTEKKGELPVTTYGYNIRSWVKSITGDLFSQTLYYNDSYAGNTPSYNGNISAMSWKIGNETLRGYKFGYDDLDRITKAEYLVNGVVNSNYKVPSITYDKHGNITALERWGKTATGYGMVDKLTMGYNGNQLTCVTDAGVKLPNTALGLNDFRDTSSATTGEYTYNKNGAMTKDLNKGISNISYNSLNLPTQLTINGTVNNYTYAADGTKLRVTHGSDVTDYVGNKIYENGSLKRILIDGGYIENGVYHFFLNDHLGNNRVVATGTGTVVQRNHYYPFGMTFGEVASSEQEVQPYQYNGKELDRKNGLNLYDYSARYMEPSLGRFTTMDPHAESYYAWSPYHYAGNNPVRITDPTGMDWYEDDEGNISWKEGSKDVKGHTKIGSSVSIQIGEDSYLNFYQNAGIKANKAIDAFELISRSKKLQNKLLGKGSTLSKESQSRLYNALIGKEVDAIAKPIGEAVTAYGIGAIAGGILGRVVSWGVGKVAAKIAEKAAKTFFNNAKYSDKVLSQIDKIDDIYHNFPKSVDGYATKYGTWSTKIGKDGKIYQWLEMPGNYGGKSGTFEFIKDVNGEINHRFFKISK